MKMKMISSCKKAFFSWALLSLDLRPVGKRILFVLQSQNSADNTPRNLLGFSCVVSIRHDYLNLLEIVQVF